MTEERQTTGKTEFSQYLPEFVSNPYPDIYVEGTPLFLDFETTILDKGSALDPGNRLVLACWQRGYGAPVEHSWGSEFEQQELAAAVEGADFIVAHNAKFELQWLVRCGVDISKLVVYDTMLAEYVIGGNRWQLQNLGLETCLQRHGLPGKVSVVSKMIKAGICPSEIPSQWLLEYCERDVTALVDLMSAQLSIMKCTRLLPVVYSRCLLTPVLADIEKYGMQLDADLIRIKQAEVKAKLRDTEIAMNEVTAGKPIVAGKQLAALLYDELGFDEVLIKKGGQWVPKRTEKDGRKTDGDTVAALKPKTSAQRRFKELYDDLNDSKQALTKYLDKWLLCVAENGGILAGSYNQMNTTTQRLSSSGRKYKTQMQNLPRAYKYLFTSSDPDWVMGEADGAQLEFRVAAHQGRDVVALQEIRGGVDVHAVTAKVHTEAGQPMSRQDAKSRTFSPLYGGKGKTDAEKEYCIFFRNKYKGIANTQNKWIAEVLRTGQLETEWGLRYYWPGTKMSRMGYVDNTTSICNFPVQAFATAEIIPLCLVAMWHVINAAQLPIRIVNTVHDSIVAEVKKGSEDLLKDVARWALTEFAYDIVQNLYGIELECRLGCGVKIGTHWGTGEETKYEAAR